MNWDRWITSSLFPAARLYDGELKTIEITCDKPEVLASFMNLVWIEMLLYLTLSSISSKALCIELEHH